MQRDEEWKRIRGQKRIPHFNGFLSDRTVEAVTKVCLACTTGGPDPVKWFKADKQIAAFILAPKCES